MPDTLITLLETIPDHRGLQGRHYPLPGFLIMALAAAMAGCDSLAAVSRFAQDLPVEMLRRLRFKKDKAPCHSAIHTILRGMDASALAQALERSFADGKPLGHVAVDGKILHGSHRDPERPLQVLSAFCLRLNAVIGSMRVPQESNEIGAMIPLLSQLPLRGAIITADAFHAQRETCTYVTQQGGDYLFFVKGNQEQLRDAIAVCFSDEPRVRAQDIRSHTTHDKGHGRIEERAIQVSTEAVPFIGWPGCKQVCRIDRWRTIRDKTSQQTIYAITSLPENKAGPAELLKTARDHWAIENKLHWIKDATFREDKSTVRIANAALSMAALRNAAIAILKQSGFHNMKAARQKLAAKPLNLWYDSLIRLH